MGKKEKQKKQKTRKETYATTKPRDRRSVLIQQIAEILSKKED